MKKNYCFCYGKGYKRHIYRQYRTGYKLCLRCGVGKEIKREQG